MYEYKYYKYKYLANKNNQRGGVRRKQILLDGVSSSGKSTIAKFFINAGYQHINSDDIDIKKLHNVVANLVDVDSYISNAEMRIIGEREKTRLMYEEGKIKDAVYDDISQNILQHYSDPEDLFVIVVYASLENLIRNILSRRFYEPRGRNVFRQYAEKFIVSNEDNDIDIVNRLKFRKRIKKKLKYLFESETDLDDFVDQIFATIFDDADHYIKLRDNFKCDYLLNIGNMTPEEIFDKLRQFTT